MIQIDTRLGGVPRYILTEEPECLMDIPDEIRKCVVFLGYKDDAGMHHFKGTGFFLGRHVGELHLSFGYLVTAKHVIDGIRDKGADRVCLRVNFKDAQARWVETDISKWHYHPDDTQTVDVAVFRLGFGFSREWDHLALPTSNFVTDEKLADPDSGIGIGSEIFLAGLFANHHGQQRNIPVVRIGNIIAMPEELVETAYGPMDAYLVEARSLGGISGSPVFVRIQMFRTNPLTELLQGAIGLYDSYYLLGLMHGHWDVEAGSDLDTASDVRGRREVNMGVAIVVPISKVLEVIDQPMITKDEKQKEAEARKRKLPKPDSLNDEEPFTASSFDDALKKSSRKISEPESEKKRKG